MALKTVNRFPGRCECGTHVPAGAGRAIKPGGKWLALCRGCDLTPLASDYAGVTPRPKPAPAPKPDHASKLAEARRVLAELLAGTPEECGIPAFTRDRYIAAYRAKVAALEAAANHG